jgi:hypothetical protein
MRITGKDDHGARFSGCDDEDWDLFIKRLKIPRDLGGQRNRELFRRDVWRSFFYRFS